MSKDMKSKWTIGIDHGTESYIAVGIRWRDKQGKMWGICRRYRNSDDANRFQDYMHAWFGGIKG